MKNYLKKLTFFIGIIIASCSSPDPEPPVILPPSVTPCNLTTNMLGVKLSGIAEYSNVLFPNSTPITTVALFAPVSFTFTYGAYNANSQEYSLVTNSLSNATLTKMNTTGILSTITIPSNCSEPVYLNNNLYLGNYETVSGVTNFRVLDQNLVVKSSIVIDAAKTTTTAATDGSRYIYYLSEPFLITYDKLNNTLSKTNLASGFTRLCGLEFKNATTLLAFRNVASISEIISLDITNPTAVVINPVFSLGLYLGHESYGTVYNACSNKYYIIEGFSSRDFIEVDLNTNTKTVSSLGTNKIIGLAFKN
jgi:hypothetical protein